MSFPRKPLGFSCQPNGVVVVILVAVEAEVLRLRKRFFLDLQGCCPPLQQKTRSSFDYSFRCSFWLFFASLCLYFILPFLFLYYQFFLSLIVIDEIVDIILLYLFVFKFLLISTFIYFFLTFFLYFTVQYLTLRFLHSIWTIVLPFFYVHL